MVKNNKAQSFSTDIMVVIVIILFGTLFLVANKVNSDDDVNVNELYDKASDDSRLIVDSLKSENIIDSDNNVKVDNLMQINVEDIKQELNIDGDFCIVFEREGKLVKIDPENEVNGVGSDKIIVNGVPCKSS
jgi:hypothetical protein